MLLLQQGAEGEAALVPVPADGAQPGEDAAAVAEAEIRVRHIPVHAEAAAVGIAQDQRVAEPLLRHRVAELRQPLLRQQQAQDDGGAFRPGEGPFRVEAVVVVALHEAGGIDQDHPIPRILRDLLQVGDFPQDPVRVRHRPGFLVRRQQGQPGQQLRHPQAAGYRRDTRQVLFGEDALPKAEFRIGRPPPASVRLLRILRHPGLQHQLDKLRFRQRILRAEGPVLKAAEDALLCQIRDRPVKPIAFRHVGKQAFPGLLFPFPIGGAGRDTQKAQRA